MSRGWQHERVCASGGSRLREKVFVVREDSSRVAEVKAQGH
jgi:hypothetical protein